jgi:hypothetical protein
MNDLQGFVSTARQTAVWGIMAAVVAMLATFVEWQLLCHHHMLLTGFKPPTLSLHQQLPLFSKDSACKACQG